MKTDKEILELAKKEVHDSGNQSWNSIALEAIELGQKELFRFLYDESEKTEMKDLTLSEFFDKMDHKLF